MTKIVSLIRREGGSHIDLGGKHYHFKPETPGGVHIADVTDKDHVKRLLSIKEGFCLLGDELDAAANLAAEIEAGKPAPKADSPADWSNKKAMAYAKEVLLINPKDKVQILELGKKHEVELDESKAPSALIRDLVVAIGVQDDEDDGADTDLDDDDDDQE